MGLLSDALKRLTAAGSGTTKPARGGRAAAEEAQEVAPIPDMDALVTLDEIEAVTGARPVGPARENGPRGSAGDVGRQLIREWKLGNGDKFLITLLACTGPDAARLATDRVAEQAKPYDGLGERGLVRVKSYEKSGKSEVGVNALRGSYTLALTHTSLAGKTDPDPLADLLRTAITRF